MDSARCPKRLRAGLRYVVFSLVAHAVLVFALFSFFASRAPVVPQDISAVPVFMEKGGGGNPVRSAKAEKASVDGLEKAAQQGAPAAAEGASPGSAYFPALSAYIRSRLVYPEAARRLGLEGRVVVRFTVLPSGEFRGIAVESPSPHERLNRAALELIREAARFQPLPPSLRGPQEVSLPIDYRLGPR